MKKLTLLFASVSLFLAASGCGKNEAVKDMEGLADRVCACKDAACAMDEAKKAMELMAKHKDTQGTDSDLKAITAAGERMQACMQKLAK